MVGPISLRLLLPDVRKAVAEVSDVGNVHGHRVACTKGGKCGHGVLLSGHHIRVAGRRVGFVLLYRLDFCGQSRLGWDGRAHIFQSVQVLVALPANVALEWLLLLHA